MTRQIATALHTIAIILQAVNLLTVMVPPQYKATVAVVIAGAQAALGWIQHNFNADGTPASVAYKPQ